MQRNQHLQPLSRQHHNGLLMALLIEKGLKKGADLRIINQFILYGWESELEHHFKAEEEVLIPALANSPMEPELTAQLLKEHEAIRKIISLAKSGSAGKGDIENFHKLLQLHIRFEERVYFPKVQAVLSNKSLEQIGQALGEDTSSNCINYPIKFWE